MPTLRTNLIVLSDFRLLRPFYISELQWLERGVPWGIVTIAQNLNSERSFYELFKVVSDQVFSKHRDKVALNVVGEYSSEHSSVFDNASSSLFEKKYRRAVQLYGWIMLNSSSMNSVFLSSIHEIRRINNELWNLGVCDYLNKS